MKILQHNRLEDVKKKIFSGFLEHSVKHTGINGLTDPVCFEANMEGQFVGAIVVQLFWGQLHIKYLLVEEAFRKQGIASQLMHAALAFAKDQGCQFAFVETMSFQAPEFYKKFGFVVELSRAGFAGNATLHYLKKCL